MDLEIDRPECISYEVDQLLKPAMVLEERKPKVADLEPDQDIIAIMKASLSKDRWTPLKIEEPQNWTSR